MKRFNVAVAATAIIAATSTAIAQDSSIGANATCTTAGLPAPVIKTVNNLQVWVRPLAVINDFAMDDFGASGAGDSLFAYCVTPTATSRLGRAAFCLTKEQCPWR